MPEDAAAEAVTVSLQDLEQGTIPFSTLEAAFGPTSLGILVVSDLPARFHPLRRQLLQYSSYLAHLPPGTLEALSVPEAKYLVGWSHGKETLKPGTYDLLKGSYYVNCAFYRDPSLQAAPANPDPSSRPFPEYTHANVWPAEDALPGFRRTFEELCRLVIDVAALVARACDRYAEAHIGTPSYEPGYLERVVRTSLTTKARLLHYFPPDLVPGSGAKKEEEEEKGGKGREYSAAEVASFADADDSWCATHLDHGCLTGLTSALFVDEGRGLPAPVPTADNDGLLPDLDVRTDGSPDPAAGLYIRSRTGQTTKVAIPPRCLAFQTGESLERITQGKFKAVPHFVRGPGPGRGGSVARNTLAVFTQPNLDELVDRERGITFADFAGEVVARNT